MFGMLIAGESGRGGQGCHAIRLCGPTKRNWVPMVDACILGFLLGSPLDMELDKQL